MPLEVAIRVTPTRRVNFRITGAGGTLTLVNDESVEVRLAPVIRGERGLQGERGPAGGAEVYLADGPIGGQRVVRPTGSGQVGYVDGATAAHAGTVLGITVGAAADGDEIEVQFQGEVQEMAWTWQLGPVFVGANGVLTQDTSALAFEQVVGIATDATTLQIQIHPAILKG